MVTRQNRYHDHQLRATHGTNQGGIGLPTLFKVAIDSVVRNWLSLTVEDEEVIQNGLGHAVGWILGVFYEYDSLLGSREPEWTQGALKILIGMFWQIRLAANVAKLKTTMCQMGAIGPGMSEEVF